VYGSGYLEYLSSELTKLFKHSEEILFIPYARPGGISHDEYTEIAALAFEKIGKKVVGLHTFENTTLAIKSATGIFTGGGNTFVLVSALINNGVMKPLRTAINSGTPYLGTSAGSNICGINMKTTNDMPIAYPSSFKTLGVIPFNINPHYLDPDPSSKHMGETRETRIQEFHTQNKIPVVGIREGGWLRVLGEKIKLEGSDQARIFKAGEAPYEVAVSTDLSDLH